jgi:hypothetical protein
LYDCGAQLSSFFNNKAELQKRVNAVPPDQRGQVEEFFALEKIKQQEEELRQLMQWTGRAGLWDDWLAFQAEAARARRKEAEKLELEAYHRRQKMKQWFDGLIIAVSVGLVLTGAVYLTLFILKYS